MTRTRCSAAADWQNHNAAEWKGRRHGATAFDAKASKCNCTKKPPKNRFIHLQVRCTLHGSFKLHKKMSTPWEVHCHDDASAVLQASVRLQFVPILKRSCCDICIKWRAPYNLWRPGLNSRASFIGATVICNVQNAHMWLASLIAFWRAGGTSRCFFVAWKTLFTQTDSQLWASTLQKETFVQITW